MRFRPLTAAVLVPVALSACVFGQRRRGGAAEQNAVLEVRNQYTGAVDVYAVREGSTSSIRVGNVFPNRTERFRLDGTIIGGFASLNFVAVPTATANRRVASGVLVVRSGDVVRFEIAPDLAGSTAYVR